MKNFPLSRMIKDIKIDLLYQQLIHTLPQNYGDLYQQACIGDKTTIESWRDIWVKNYKAAKEHFGEFGTKSYGKLYGVNRQKPCIIIGSGPSLQNSLEDLKKNSEAKNPVTTISCLHNFGLFEDSGFHADYYLSLDSGGVVIEDVSESRNKDGNFYWEKTKGKKLIAYAGSDPRLWGLWQGEIYLFNSLIPDATLLKQMKDIEPFSHYISSGGNASGACFYTAKAVMCSDPIIFVGVDMCFSYDNTFHSYKTQYDTLGQYLQWPDCYGIPRKTWASYLNFKFWFDDRVMKIPGNYINCSDGLLGAYKEGNLSYYKYLPLRDALIPYQANDVLAIEQRDHSTGELIKREDFLVKDYFENPKYEHDVTFF